LAIYGEIVIILHVVYSVVAATYTKTARRRQITRPYLHAGTASWRTERNPISPTIGAAATRRKRSAKKSAKKTKDHYGKGSLF
jgi:uncharacterized protein YpuA (DUF1002 family)